MGIAKSRPDDISFCQAFSLASAFWLMKTTQIRRKRMRTFKLVLFSLVLVLGLTGISFGQETTGTIEGTVKDPSSAVVPGVSVTVTGTGYSRTVTTDDAGFFRVQQVPPGRYTVTTAAISGFGESTSSNVEVVLGKTTPVMIALQLSLIHISEPTRLLSISYA